MTERERWTVYPLLFLALGIAVKDKVVRVADVDTVQCNRLVVQDRQGKEQAVLAATPTGSVMRAGVIDSDSSRTGRLVVHDRQGREQVVIVSSPAGGLIRTEGNDESFDVLLGHAEQVEGLMFVDAAGNLYNRSVILPKIPVKPPQGPQPPKNGKQPEAAPHEQGQEPASQPDADKSPETAPAKQ